MRAQLEKSTENADKMVFILLMLDRLMDTFYKELKDELKGLNVYRLSIKQKLNEIRDMLKSNPSLDWRGVDEKLFLQSADHLELMEEFYKRIMGIENGYALVQKTDYKTGDEVYIKGDKGIIEKIIVETTITDNKDLESELYKVKMIEGEKKGKTIKAYLCEINK